jgi:hypothetical protein
VALEDDLARAAERAGAFAAPGETIEAVLAVEPAAERRLYLCSFALGAGSRSWLMLNQDDPVKSRALVREAVALAALCEVVGEAIGDEPPRLASPAYLDEHGAPDVVAAAFSAVEALTQEVESTYKRELE